MSPSGDAHAHGAPVQPDAAGCCVGLVGIASSGYTTCASEPTTSGTLVFTDSGEAWLAFTFDRHDMSSPSPTHSRSRTSTS